VGRARRKIAFRAQIRHTSTQPVTAQPPACRQLGGAETEAQPAAGFPGRPGLHRKRRPLPRHRTRADQRQPSQRAPAAPSAARCRVQPYVLASRATLIVSFFLLDLAGASCGRPRLPGRVQFRIEERVMVSLSRIWGLQFRTRADGSASPPAYRSGFHQRRVSMAHGCPQEEVAIQSDTQVSCVHIR
jgi:hypothetical protein